MIRCHLIPALGHLPLQDLRPDHVQGLYNEKLRKGLTPGTIWGIHVVLHGALKQAIKHQLVLRNVTEATAPPSLKRHPIQPLTLSELETFLKAIAQDRLFPAILLAFGTGLRRGELLALCWKDINLEAGLVHVRQKLARMRVNGASEGSKKTRLIFQPPKTEQSRRTIPIAPDIVEALRRHKARQAQEKLLMGQAYEDQDLVFCLANGHPLEPVGFYRRFVQLVQQAGLAHHRLHDARHTFATLMLELGESPKTVQTMLGHASITTTLDIYSHVSLELETRAAVKLSDALLLAQQ